jgi:hypothetical protein
MTDKLAKLKKYYRGFFSDITEYILHTLTGVDGIWELFSSKLEELPAMIPVYDEMDDGITKEVAIELLQKGLKPSWKNLKAVALIPKHIISFNEEINYWEEVAKLRVVRDSSKIIGDKELSKAADTWFQHVSEQANSD